MPVRLDEPGGGTISVNRLKDGQIANVVSWSSDGMSGRVVMFVNGTLVDLVRGDHFVKGRNYTNVCRVRVLPNGTTLTVEDNE